MSKKEKVWQLDYACKIGDRVKWKTIKGDTFEGTLYDWDENVAIVKLDNGTFKSIEC